MDNNLDKLSAIANKKGMKIKMNRKDSISFESLHFNSSSYSPSGGWWKTYQILDELQNMIGFVYITQFGITVFELEEKNKKETLNNGLAR